MTRCVALLLVLAASCVSPSRARADGDWGRPVSVEASASAEGDLTALHAPLVVDGTLLGDASTLFGDVIVRGRVEGDVVALFGRIRVAGDGALVTGNAFSVFGGIDVSDGGRVGGDMRVVVPLDPLREAGYFSIAWSRPLVALRLVATLFWLLSALAAAVVAPRAVVVASAALLRSGGRLALLGVLSHAALLLSALLCTALVVVFIGIPLLMLLLLAWMIAQCIALGAVFHALGGRVAERVGRGAMSGYAEVLLGALIVGILLFIPVLGELVFIATCILGMGAVVGTRFARR